MKNYIKKLHAKNIGIFNSLDIEFSPDINIIIGPNSMGKTSILKTIAYSFSIRNLNFTRFRKDAEYWIDFESNNKKYRAGATNLTEKDQDYRSESIKGYGNVPRDGVDEIFQPYGEVPYNLLAIGANRYFDYTRIEGMKKEEKGENRKKFYNHNNALFLEKPHLPAIKQWMINRYFIIEKDWAEIEKKNWNKVIDFLPFLAPEIQNFKFKKIERNLEPVFSINDNLCYLEELSGGFKSILSIVFSIIDWCEGVNEGEKGNIEKSEGTVLIDELDAHLHPEWQYDIVKNLRFLFPKIQFIITTHSPYIVSSAKKNQILRLPSHNGTLDIKPLNRSFKGWQIDNILSDLMDVEENSQIESDELLNNIDKAIQEKNKDEFEKEFRKLKKVLHSDDPIIKVYEIKRSKIFL